MNLTLDTTPPPPPHPGRLPARSTHPVAVVFAALVPIFAILAVLL